MTTTDPYAWNIGEKARRAEAERRLAEARAEAARRTGWEPWMTSEVGYAAEETTCGWCNQTYLKADLHSCGRFDREAETGGEG